MGNQVFIRQSPGMVEWLERFPELRKLTVSDDSVKFTDKREWGVNPRLFQRFGVDYSRQQLRDFITECLAPNLELASQHGVVLNIRRGDYYSVAEFRAAYGMNIVGYVDAALTRVGRAGSLLVVSDDAPWCRKNLGAALEGVADAVEYAAPGAWQHFNAVSSARCLVGTNSSFSYWGGYITDTLTDDALVIMPKFHKRTINDGAADQLDPRWYIIENIPGGWAP